MNDPRAEMRDASAFSLFLRTGRRWEVKFNPWHDPDDGRFTFAGTGRYFPRGMGGQGGPRGSTSARSPHDPAHPKNYALYTVQRGDTLSKIALQRRGLRVSDLAWLNGIENPDQLRIGQRIRLPNQSYLEAGRTAKNRFLALAHYTATHGGQLPPNAANPPSLEEQLASERRVVSANGYNFDVDGLGRPHAINGTLVLEQGRRSKDIQLRAGGKDRRPTDQGGHYVGVPFNGPRASFNHFAQDGNFNRSAYRRMENEWAANLRAQRKVTFRMTISYQALSRRPSLIVVHYNVDNVSFTRRFPNEAGEK